jgi:two-component system alkaline phosphatase synthesis response regulator PhoP
MARRALVVEDDPDIVELVEHYLSGDGWSVDSSGRGREALRKARSGLYQLLVLDLQLPDLDGLSICAELRRDPKTMHLPIVMLTARGDETDRIVGLEGGADDYIVKPFSARELVARVRAVLRRAQREPGTDDEPLEVGGLRLDQARHEATLDGDLLDLTLKEFEVLRLLMRNAGAVVSRDQLIDEVWDVNWFGPTKTLDVHVSGLRKKLGDDPAAPRYLYTVRGVGFRCASSDELDTTDRA